MTYSYLQKSLFFVFVVGMLFSFNPLLVHADDTWETVTPSGSSASTFTTIASMGDVVYLGTDSGVYKSTNAGTSWTAVNTGLTNVNVTSIAIGWIFDGEAYVVDSASPVFVGTQGGVFKSTLGGTTWTSVNTGLTNTVVNDVEIDQYQALVEGAFTNVYAATEGGVYLSTNEGASWTLVDDGMTSLPVQKLTSDFNGYMYALSTDEGISKIFSNNLFSVTGTNDTWTEIYSESGTTTRDIAMLNPIGSINWVATDQGILKSEDNGTDWTVRNIGLSTTSVYTVVSDYVEANIAYAAIEGGGVYRTTNEALQSPQWVPINKELDDRDIIKVVTNPEDATKVFAMSEEGVYRLVLSDLYVDLTLPSTITDLEVDSVTETHINLSWTAPGDDGMYGTSTTYSVRHSPSLITEGNWDSATTMVGQPTPSGYGYAETYSIATLDTSVPYYFAIKSIDEDGNESVISNVVFTGEEDTADPVISNVSAGSLSTSGATITWTTNESATSQVVYGTSAGTYTLFSTSGSLVTEHSRSLSSLGSNTTYYYVVVSTDASGNTATSSEASFTTSAASSGGGSSGGSSSSSSGSSSSSSSRSSGGGGGSSKTTTPVVTAAVNTTAAVTPPPGCLPGYLFNIHTGKPCTAPVVTPQAGCLPGYLFNIFTGNPCSTTVVVLPPGCLPGYLFSIETGKPCSSSTLPLTVVATTTAAPAPAPSSVFTPSAPVPTPPPSPTLFTRDLTLGSVGEDVRALQVFLNSQGYIVAIVGPGSRGNETDVFGVSTLEALARFQVAKRIFPAAGYFGGVTRSYISQ